MSKKHKPTERHKDLAEMFLKMGRALTKEGIENKDYITASLGNSMVFLSSLTYDKNEAKFFSEFCSMMTSKRLVRGVVSGKMDFPKFENLKDIQNTDPFEQILKRINDEFDEMGDDEDEKE